MRLIGNDMFLFELDDTVGFVSPDNYRNHLRDFEVAMSNTYVDTKSIRELTPYNKRIGKDWRVTYEIQLDDTFYPTVLDYCQNDTTIYVRGEGSSPLDGTTYHFEGAGAVSEVVISGSRNASQVARVTIVPRGDLVYSLV